MELGHFNASQLVDYFSGFWTPDQQREIEIHLSQCDACTMLARRVYVEAFVIDSWSAKVMAEKAKAEKPRAKGAAASAKRSAAAH